MCCNMQWVCILADKMQSIVTGIGVVRSHSCLRFLCGLPLSHCLAGLEIGTGFGESVTGSNAVVILGRRALPKLAVFWVISVDVGF